MAKLLLLPASIRSKSSIFSVIFFAHLLPWLCFQHMFAVVLSRGQQHEVFKAVITSIAVDVVNVLKTEKRSTIQCFHDNAMFKRISFVWATGDQNTHIPLAVDMASSLIGWMPLAAQMWISWWDGLGVVVSWKKRYWIPFKEAFLTICDFRGAGCVAAAAFAQTRWDLFWSRNVFPHEAIIARSAA